MNAPGRTGESRAAARHGADTAVSATPLPRPGLGTYYYPSTEDILEDITRNLGGCLGKVEDYRAGRTDAARALREIGQTLPYLLMKLRELGGKL